MNKKIYIVTSGNYSDYHIDAVFSTKNKAESYIQQHGTGYRIEEYDLDEEVVNKKQIWSVAFNIKDKSLEIASPTMYKIDKYKDTCIVRECGFDSYIEFIVESDNMDKAKKIASERFAAVKSNDYIWLRLTRPYCITKYGRKEFERFNVKTNEFTKE